VRRASESPAIGSTVASTPGPSIEAFEELTLPHLSALYNLALNLTRDPADAEDLLQETYFRAYRFFDQYRPGTNVRAWLFKILRNGFINRYRRARREPEEVDFSKVESAFESIVERVAGGRAGGDPESDLMARSLDEPINAAMRALPSEYRVVLLLAVVEGFTYREIAAVLDCPIGTVMSRLHRARRFLQVRLLEYARRRGLPGAQRKAGTGVERRAAGDRGRRRRPETG
jgi:RNA polymerase sigma-70 factor (ECF subfamily)